jgi:hypothetical protein
MTTIRKKLSISPDFSKKKRRKKSLHAGCRKVDKPNRSSVQATGESTPSQR